MATLSIACSTFGLLVLVALQTALAAPSGILPIALCTPENSACGLASDGNASTCFVAAKIQENFYFAVFNTVGRLVTVNELKLLVGGAGRTNYSVSLASNAQAHELRCKAEGGDSDAKKPTTSNLLDCLPAEGRSNNGLTNVSSLMIRSELLQIRMRLLEVIAYTEERTQVQFAYCSAEEPAVCARAIDGKFAPNSPAVESEPAAFPSWYGVFNSTDSAKSVASVRLYRPYNNGATFFRVVLVNGECAKTGESLSDDGVEALDFACPRRLNVSGSSQLELWEFDADFLVNLCEIQVFGQGQ